MKTKAIVTTGLLLFVAVCVAVVVVQETRRAISGRTTVENGDARPEAEGAADSAESPNADAAVGSGKTGDKVIVYCFHRTDRCPACIKLEGYTKKVLHGAFAEQLEDGSVELRVVDYEQPKNEHFRDEFALFGATLVLVRVQAGKTVGFENLINLSTLVDHELVFAESLKERLKAFRDESP
jgi:hypothetical protein